MLARLDGFRARTGRLRNQKRQSTHMHCEEISMPWSVFVVSVAVVVLGVAAGVVVVVL